MECTYSLWEVALTNGLAVGLGIGIVYYSIKYCIKLWQDEVDENGKVGRDKKGRFKSLK